MFSVVATKIRTGGADAASAERGRRIYEGYLLCAPTVGRGLVLFRGRDGKRMVTSAVRRLLTTSDDSVVYVETENSVYRLLLRPENQANAVAG